MPSKKLPADVALFEGLLASKPAKREGGTTASITSVVIHAAIIAGLIYVPVRAASNVPHEQSLLVMLPEDKPIPLPPPVQPPPAAQSVNPASVPLGFTTIAVPELVPTDIPTPQPGLQIRAENFEPLGVAGGSPNGTAGHGTVADATAQPFMTPMDVPPKLLNREEVTAAISRNYPPMMRDAGIGGTTKVWFYIDATGHSIKQVVKTGSGYAVFDSAALRVAPVMRFTPATSQMKAVPVWVAMDIVFTIR
jgi:protein TonB